MSEMQFTPAQLAQLLQVSEEMREKMLAVEASIKAGEAGSFQCFACPSDAKWTRDGSQWLIECPDCGWSAAGSFPQSDFPKN